jgi:hypothetical protein
MMKHIKHSIKPLDEIDERSWSTRRNSVKENEANQHSMMKNATGIGPQSMITHTAPGAERSAPRAYSPRGWMEHWMTALKMKTPDDTRRRATE